MSVDSEEFEQFEEMADLFSITIDDIPVWERIRFDVFHEIGRQNGTGEAHTRLEYDLSDYLRGGYLWARNIVYRNPYLAGSHDFLFVGHHRRKLEEDGYWWDIYCDPIHESTELDYVHMELPHLLSHHRPAKTGNLRYLELIDYGGLLQRKLNLRTPSIPAKVVTKLENAESEIKRRFDADVNLVSRTKNALHVRNTTLGFYERVLNRVDPEVVVDVVSYGSETLIEACKRKEIPVVELQHGVIYDHHYGYSYPKEHPKHTFPDYLFTFGEFWNANARYPIPDERVIPVGYPYLEKRSKTSDERGPSDQIIFISQGTIGDQLSKFAVETHNDPRIDYNIVYKLHPGEYDRWSEEYPWLVDSGIKVIDGPNPALYEIFAESSVQIGVGSTAIYEGLCFNLNTFIYDCVGSEILTPLVEEGVASMIATVDDLIEGLDSDRHSQFDRTRFFRPNSVKKIEEQLKRIANEGSTFKVQQ